QLRGRGLRHVRVHAGPQEVHERETRDDREQARERVVAERLTEEPAELPGASERRDAGHDRGEHERDDDHAQESHEEVPEPSDRVRGRHADDEPRGDAEQDRDEHLPVEPPVPGEVRVVFHRRSNPRGRWMWERSRTPRDDLPGHTRPAPYLRTDVPRHKGKGRGRARARQSRTRTSARRITSPSSTASTVSMPPTTRPKTV